MEGEWGRGQNRGSDSNSLTCPVYNAEWEDGEGFRHQFLESCGRSRRRLEGVQAEDPELWSMGDS